MNCNLTGDPQPWVDAAASRRMSSQWHAPPWPTLAVPGVRMRSVTYLNCEMGAHIKPEGWNNWRNPTNELTARFAEYNSTGPGANPDRRVKWSKQLTSDEANQITVLSVLSGDDGWNPAVVNW